MKAADKDGDGTIDYDEFVSLLLRREPNFAKLKEVFEGSMGKTRVLGVRMVGADEDAR